MKERSFDVGIIKASIYMISILWSAYLIWISYKRTADISTALITVIVLLANMIFNDLLKSK